MSSEVMPLGQLPRFRGLGRLEALLAALYGASLLWTFTLTSPAEQIAMGALLVAATTLLWGRRIGIVSALWALSCAVVVAAVNGELGAEGWRMLISGGIVYFVIALGLGWALENLRRQISAARVNSERLEVMVANSPDSLFQMDRSLRYTWFSGSTLDRTANDLVGHTDYDFFDRDEADRLSGIKRRVLDTGERANYESHFPVGGKVHYFHTIAEPTRDETGAIVGLAGYRRDVTERREVEKATLESARRMQNITDNMLDVVAEIDVRGKYVYSCPSVEAMLGYPPEELVGQDALALVHPADIPAAKASLDRALSGEAMRATYRYRHASGEYIRIETLGKVVIEAGQAAGLVLVYRDVTERIRADERYQTILSTAIDGFWRTDAAGRFLEVNDAYCQMVGYSRDELLTMGIRDVEAVEMAEETAVHMATLVKKGYDRFETRHQSRDGSLIDVEVSVNYVPYESGQLFVFVRDITERKRAEENSSRERSFLENITENIGVGLCTISRDYHIIWQNGVMRQGFGDMEGKPCHLAYNQRPDVCPGCGARQVFEQGAEKVVTEQVSRKVDGSMEWSELTVTPIRNEQGQVTGATEVVVSITERKLAEEELRRSEKESRTIFDSLNDVLLIRDLNGRFHEANRAACERLGYSREELLTLSLADIQTPEVRETAPARMQKILQQGRAVFEAPSVTKKGEVIPLEVSVQTIDYRGAPAVLSIGRDISERKRSEAMLRSTNDQLDLSVKELERQASESALLSTLSDLLQACLTPEEAYPVVASAAARLFPEDSGAVFVLRASRNMAEAVAAWGQHPPDEEALSPGECWALRRGRTYSPENGRDGLQCPRLAGSEEGFICVPLIAQSEIVGVLTLRFGELGRQETLSVQRRDRKQVLAATFADQVALALANLRLRESLRNQAIRDPLTGLFNRRYMEETVERELSRASRAGSEVGIVMLDVDHFKAYNDSFGHEAGDVLLAALGSYLRTCLRAGDIACRYGGEEFLLVLPDAAFAAVVQRVQALLDGVREIRPVVRGRTLESVTVSIGVAAYPWHGSNGETLLRAADEALYRAKAEGRARVVACSPPERGEDERLLAKSA